MQGRRSNRFRNAKNGLPQDRRLCTDGFIIRAQAMIRADGLRPRKLGEGLRVACEGLRAARANHVQFVRIQHPYKLDAVLGQTGCRVDAATDFAMPKTVYPKIVDCARMVSSSVRKR
jgi:hypothetical protein